MHNRTQKRCTAGKNRAYIMCTAFHTRVNEICTEFVSISVMCKFFSKKWVGSAKEVGANRICLEEKEFSTFKGVVGNLIPVLHPPSPLHCSNQPLAGYALQTLLSISHPVYLPIDLQLSKSHSLPAPLSLSLSYYLFILYLSQTLNIPLSRALYLIFCVSSISHSLCKYPSISLSLLFSILNSLIHKCVCYA